MEDILRQEYQKLNLTGLTLTGKCNILNNIVQLKFQEPNYKNFQNDISIDIKKYLISIIELAELGAKSYDTIKDAKINELFDSIDKSEHVQYIDYWIRQLQKSSFENEVKNYQKLKTKTIIFNALENFWCIKSWVQLFTYIPIYNLFTLLMTLISLSFLTCILLLPAPNENMEILKFKIEYSQLSNNFYINHFTNIIAALVGVNSEFKIVPKDLFSQITLIFAKVFVFIYVITVLLNKLSELIKR